VTSPTRPIESHESVVEASGLSKRFGPTKALDGVSMRVSRGEVAVVVGPNGSGKSTLLKVICGVIRHPKSSRVEVLGYNPWSQRHLLFRKATAMFEDYAFPDFATGLEYLQFLMRIRGVEKVDLTLASGAMFDLNTFWDKPIRGYSSGMKRKLALAQALIGEPDLLIFDEPLVAIDRASRDQFVDELARRKERGATVVISSHILTDLEKIATDLTILVNGRVVSNQDVGASSVPLEEIYRKALEEV
jgi:ABC-type multidrug transport system ATPase subunit